MTCIFKRFFFNINWVVARECMCETERKKDREREREWAFAYKANINIKEKRIEKRIDIRVRR